MDTRTRRLMIERREQEQVASRTNPFGEAPDDGRRLANTFKGTFSMRLDETSVLSKQLEFGPRLTPHIPPLETRGTLKQVVAVVQGRIAGVVLDTPAEKKRVIRMFAAGARGGIRFEPSPVKAVARSLRKPTHGPVVHVSPKTGNRWSEAHA